MKNLSGKVQESFEVESFEKYKSSEKLKSFFQSF